MNKMVAMQNRVLEQVDPKRESPRLVDRGLLVGAEGFSVNC
jgi:hypothetical protein